MSFGYAHKLVGHGDTIAGLHIYCETFRTCLISCSLDGSVMHWDLNERKIIYKTKLPKITNQDFCIFQILDDMLYVGYSEGLLGNFALESMANIHIFKGHTDQVTALSIYDSSILSASQDCSVRRWESKTGLCEVVYQFSDPISDIIVKNTQLYVASWDRCVKIIDLEEGVIVTEFLATDKPIRCMCVDGNTIFVGGCGLVVISWELPSLKSLEYKGMKSWALGIKVVGSLLFGFSDDKMISVWDKITGKLLEQFSGHHDGITCMELTEDFIYSGSFDQSILIWDIEEMKVRISERALMTREDIESRKIETFFRALNTKKKGKKNKKGKKSKKK